MDHTALKYRALDRDRARRGLGAQLQFLAHSRQTGYEPKVTLTAGWSAKRTTRFVLGQEFFEIRIAEYDTAKPRQVVTATVVGVITLDGDIEVIVTADGMDNSPKTFAVPVLNADNAAVVTGKIRAALSADENVGHATTGFFTVSGSGASVVLTVKTPRLLDSTMNVAIENGTAAGLTEDATSQSSHVASLTEAFDRNLSHALIDGRYHKIKQVVEPKRSTRVWTIRTAPTGEKTPTP